MHTIYDDKELNKRIRKLDSILSEVLEQQAEPQLALALRHKCEYQRCFDWILDITSSKALWKENWILASCLKRRYNFLGSLNFIQAVLLRQLPSTEVNRRIQPLLRAINAISPQECGILVNRG